MKIERNATYKFPVSHKKTFLQTQMTPEEDLADEDLPEEDPVLDPAAKGRLIKCRITRNRKGVRGEYRK